MYMCDGSLWLRNVELWDWSPPHHHQAAGQKHIVYSKFVGLYSIMTVATPLPSPPPPRPPFYMSHKCSVWINVQSCGRVLRRLLVDSVLCPLTRAATERESLIQHNLWPHHRLSLLPPPPHPPPAITVNGLIDRNPNIDTFFHNNKTLQKAFDVLWRSLDFWAREAPLFAWNYPN